ncbi:purine-cytosine permease family protein [Rubrobacter naiadicus]|uniref:purine-cytosine permease family protein n=1 Tax=Rubrobacter naiadicus TaxID=1392641 RepID=UPI00235F9D3A|nr:cytosine permease [Rubrobacter naiadicus]
MNIERRSIEHIPSSERHGRANSLFTVWFSANMQVTAVATGIIAISLGLNLTWAIITIIVGNLIGAIFMAYHSAQGPKLGLPQMIQSRAQFGMFGAVLPLILVILMYIGFFSSSAVLGGQAIAGLLHIPIAPGIIICNALTLVLAVFGYDMVHRYDRVVAYIFAVIFAIVTIKLIGSLPEHYAAHGITAGNILLAISIPATWQITYAPYVADYSRYLPEDTSISSTFWWTYLGSVIGTSWMMIMGAMAGTIALKEISANTSGYLSHLLGASFSWLILIVIALGIFAVNVMNLYGSFMSLTTTLTSFVNLRVAGRTLRIIISSVAAAIGSAIAIWGQGNFLGLFEEFILLLAFFLIPWTAINLVDFYFVKHGSYSIPELFKKNGIYKAINWKTIAVYILTIVIQVPFMNSALYTGPLSKYMGGADISWLVGIILAGGLYYLVADRTVPDITQNPTDPGLERAEGTM